MPLNLQKVIADFPELVDLFTAVEQMLADEKTATTWAAHQKATEAVQEKLAVLIDTIEAQSKTP